MKQHLIYSSGTLTNNELDTRISIVNSGKIILNNVDSLSSQLVDANCEYIVIYNFDLNNGSITIPNNCTLNFKGGSISNGTITLQNTRLEGDIRWDGVTISGSCTNDLLTPQMFGARAELTADSTKATRDTLGFQNLKAVLNNSGTRSKYVHVPSGHYALNARIEFMASCNFYGDGESTIIDCYDGSGGLGFGYDNSKSNSADRYFSSCQLLNCTLSVDTNILDDYITVTDTSELQVGNYLILHDTKSSSFSTRAYYESGEIIKISQIVGNRVYLTSTLLCKYFADFGEDYTTTHTISPARRTAISKFTPSHFNISDIKIVSHSYSGMDSEHSPSTYYTLTICGVEDSYFKNIIVENSGNAVPCCIKLGLHYIVDQCIFRNLVPYGLTSNQYGLKIDDSQFYRVSNSTFRAPWHSLSTGVGSSVYDVMNSNFIYENLYFENFAYDTTEATSYYGGGIDLDVHGSAHHYKFINIDAPHTICDTGGYSLTIDNCRFYKISATFNESDITIRNSELMGTEDTTIQLWNENAHDYYTNNSLIIENTKLHAKLTFDYQNSSYKYSNLILKNNICDKSITIRNGMLENLVVENNTFGIGARFSTGYMSFDNISFKHNVFKDGHIWINSANQADCVIVDNYINKATNSDNLLETHNIVLNNISGYVSNNILRRSIDDSHRLVSVERGDVKITSNIFKLEGPNKDKSYNPIYCADGSVSVEGNIHNIYNKILYIGENASGIEDSFPKLNVIDPERTGGRNSWGKTIYINNNSVLAYIGSRRSQGSSLLQMSFGSSNPFLGAHNLEYGKFYGIMFGGSGNHRIYFSKYNDTSNPDFEDSLIYQGIWGYEFAPIQVPTDTSYQYLYIKTSRDSITANVYPAYTLMEYDGSRLGVSRSGDSSSRPGGFDIKVGFIYNDTTLSKPIYAKSISGNTVTWVESDGATAGVKRIGTTAERPTGNSIYVGFRYYDTDLGKEICASAISGNTVTWTEMESSKLDSSVFDSSLADLNSQSQVISAALNTLNEDKLESSVFNSYSTTVNSSIADLNSQSQVIAAALNDLQKKIEFIMSRLELDYIVS